MSEALRILQEELQAQLNRLHNEVRKFYKKDPVVTLVLRVPELPNSELILTNDPDQEEVIAIIKSCSQIWWGLHCPHEGHSDLCPSCRSTQPVGEIMRGK